MTRLTLYDIALRFREPLVTAAGTYPERRSVIVALETDGITGWGEAATMPSGAWGSIDEVWEELLAGAATGIGPAAAAMQAARADCEARRAGVPLWRRLGASGRPVPARVTFGLHDSPDTLVAAVQRVTDTGVAAVKIKITPGRDLLQIAAVRTALPDLDISVDANGAYASADDPVFVALDELGVGSIEQPFPPGNLSASAALRTRVAIPVGLDEVIRSVDDAANAIAAGAADVLSLKIGRLGLETSRAILAIASDAGVGIKAGGTFDTAVGRHMVLAFAGLPGVVDAEAGPPDTYLVDPPGRYPPVVDGSITPDTEPGTGDVIDHDELARIAIRTREVTGLGARD